MTTLPGPYFTIGVVGHRPNRLPAPLAVASDIADLLDLAKESAGRSSVMLVTSLAEGTDRIAAHEAVSRKLLLKAVLPFDREEYALDFPNSLTEFRALVQVANQVVELPGQRNDAPAAYEAAARQVLRDAALLIAVWDGGPSGGRGGTTETIARAAQNNVPVLWVDAAGLKRPVTIPPNGALPSVIARAGLRLR